MPTCLFTVKAALVDLLEAAEWPGTTPVVSYGAPRDLPAELVMVGGTTDWSQSWAQIGHMRRTEEFTLACVVNVLLEGMSQRESNTRAHELLSTIEAVMLANPGVPGLDGTATPGVLWCEFTPSNLVEEPQTTGYETELQFGFHVTARI